MFNQILSIVENSAISGGFKWDSIPTSEMASAKLAAAYCALSEAMADSDIPRRDQRKILDDIKAQYEIPKSAFLQSADRFLMKSDINQVTEIVKSFSI